MTRWFLRYRVAIPAAVVALLLVGGGVATQVSASPMAFSCTVGYAGTDLNIAISGLGAGAGCQHLIAQAPQVDGQAPLGSGYDTSPSGTFMCRYTLDGLTYTVRDSGMLKAYGTSACNYLQQQTPEAKAAAARAAAAQAQAQAEAARQQAEQQAAAQAQAEADARAAADQDLSTVQSDLQTLAKDAQAAAAGPSSVAADMQQAAKDLGVTKSALQQVQAEGSGSSNCMGDADNVQGDADTVQGDADTVQGDQDSQQGLDDQVASNIQSLQSDFAKLQSAEQTASYTPDGAVTQDQVDQAVNGAKAKQAQGDKSVAGDLSQANAMVDQANKYATQAQSVCS